MTKRNKAVGPWAVESVRTVGTTQITVEIADMLDTKLNTRYREGSYRVTIKSDLPDRPRTKTFHGESAWSAAARYATDAAFWAMRAEDGR